MTTIPDIVFIILLFGFHLIEIVKLRKLSKRIDHLCTPVKLNNTWRLKYNQEYYYLGSAGTVCHRKWRFKELDEQIRAFMGIYETEGETITARENIIRELQQLHEGVNNLLK